MNIQFLALIMVFEFAIGKQLPLENSPGELNKRPKVRAESVTIGMDKVILIVKLNQAKLNCLSFEAQAMSVMNTLQESIGDQTRHFGLNFTALADHWNFTSDKEDIELNVVIKVTNE